MKKTTVVALNGGRFYLGVLMGALLVGCAGAAFPFKFYYLDLNTFDGILTADKPADDLNVSVCKLDQAGDHTCVVMIKSEFQALYLDYLDVKNKLNTCESSK